MPKKLTAEEVERVNANAQEFLARINAVPPEDRVLLTSDKFAGPIGTNVVTPDDEQGDSPDGGGRPAASGLDEA